MRTQKSIKSSNAPLYFRSRMSKAIVAVAVLAILSLSAISVLTKDFSVLSVRASRTWIVDKSGQGDFYYIQEAINAAEAGDLIKVMSGTFYEHLVVNKSVTLMGENSNSCIVDGNETGNVVTVNANSVYISGFTVQGSGENQQGVILDQSGDDSILGNIVVSNYYGVLLNSSQQNVIRDNLVQGNVWGIYLQDSRNNTIENNTVANNYRRGLHLSLSDGNVVDENTVANNYEGIYLEFSTGNWLRKNNLTDNAFGFGVLGSRLADFIQDIDTSNRMDDEPIYYWVNQRDRPVPTDAGYVAVINSTGITVRDLNLTRQQEGPLLAYTNDSTIENVHVSNARYGFRLIGCKNLNVIGNRFAGDADGIRLDYCLNITVSKNVVTNSEGEALFLDHSNSSLFTENTVMDSAVGMYVYYSTYNGVYHNNFVNNTGQVLITLSKNLVLNTWDRDGEGNYWSDHVNPDSDGNGIVDTPEVFNMINQDDYPLAGLFSDFAVGPEESRENVTLICNSTISSFECDFSTKTISFNATGPEGSVGFCRIAFPRELFNGSYEVLIDGSLPLTQKELSSSDPTKVVLYFTYANPTEKVTIIPEYSLVMLFLLAIASLTLALTRRVHRMSRKQ